MAFIHYFVKRFLHFILHIFWLFPIKRNRIFLLNELSFKYGDNLKYLNEYIKNNYKCAYEVIFPLYSSAEAAREHFVYVKPLSLRYFKYILTSKVIITNAGGISYLPVRRTQLVINTWWTV